MSLQNPVPDVGEKTRRQHSEIIAIGLCSGHRPQIRTGPEKIVSFELHSLVGNRAYAKRSVVLLETTVMQFTIWDIRGCLFDTGLSAIKHAYSQSKSSMERDKEKAKQVLQKFVADSNDQIPYKDDATGPWFDIEGEIEDQVSIADETLRIVREAFLLSLYHYWEKQVQLWMSVKDYKQDQAFDWLTDQGLKPDKTNLDLLRMTVNCIKHNNSALYTKNPIFFDASRIVGSTPDYHGALRITDEHLDLFFEAIRMSGPLTS